jgi:hypothetical protein
MMLNNLKNRIMECADVIALGEGSAGVSPAPAGVSPDGSPEVSGETPDAATETVALPAVHRARAPQPRAVAEKARTI